MWGVGEPPAGTGRSRSSNLEKKLARWTVMLLRSSSVTCEKGRHSQCECPMHCHLAWTFSTLFGRVPNKTDSSICRSPVTSQAGVAYHGVHTVAGRPR